MPGPGLIMLKSALATMVVVAALALIASGCSSNKAKSYVPGASELCCHGNWKATPTEEDRACKGYYEDLFRSAEGCWERSYYNVKIRPGEPDSLNVIVAVMNTDEEARTWLAQYSPSAHDDIERDENPPPNVGWEAKAWEIPSLSGTEVAFRRHNVVVLVYVWTGSLEGRRVMVESVDEAVLDRFLEWEDYPP